jgi:hypothetical protein
MWSVLSARHPPVNGSRALGEPTVYRRTDDLQDESRLIVLWIAGSPVIRV